MNVLVDTSVWVDHFRRANAPVVSLLARDEALTHPMIMIELACGTPPAPRTRTLTDVGLLQRSQQESFEELIAFVERERLYGLGCGLVYIALLASALKTPGTRL